MRSVEFHVDAQEEFVSAARFYERQAEGLGQSAYEIPKFPYGLVYRVEPNRIYIIAVMHLHRPARLLVIEALSVENLARDWYSEPRPVVVCYREHSVGQPNLPR